MELGERKDHDCDTCGIKRSVEGTRRTLIEADEFFGGSGLIERRREEYVKNVPMVSDDDELDILRKEEDEEREWKRTAVSDYEMELERRKLIEEIRSAEGQKFRVIRGTNEAGDDESEEEEEEEEDEDEDEEETDSETEEEKETGDFNGFESEQGESSVRRKVELKNSCRQRNPQLLNGLKRIYMKTMLKNSEEDDDLETTDEEDEEKTDDNEDELEEYHFVMDEEEISDDDERKEVKENKDDDLRGKQNVNSQDEEVGQTTHKKAEAEKMKYLHFNKSKMTTTKEETNKLKDEHDNENDGPKRTTYHMHLRNYKDENDRLLFYSDVGKPKGYFDTSSNIHFFHLDKLPFEQRASKYMKLASTDWVCVLNLNNELVRFFDSSGRHDYFVKPSSMKASFCFVCHSPTAETDEEDQYESMSELDDKEDEDMDDLTNVLERCRIIEDKMAKFEFYLQDLQNCNRYAESRMQDFQYFLDDTEERMIDLERKSGGCYFRADGFPNKLKDFRESVVDFLMLLDRMAHSVDCSESQWDKPYGSEREYYAKRYPNRPRSFYHNY
ncbi:uncharacterized protein LOC143031982 [Oratosquilla oratoria]|uniref:uncharacterized protein LOC143031982 n=1 Tax=Oratosquilla oratoria TaxID=337810 RepID=UPI003F76C994